MESKIFELLFSIKHLLLIGSLISILSLLRGIPKVNVWLFGDKNGGKIGHKWLIGPINLFLGLVFSFAGLTDFSSVAMKIAIALMSSAFSTLCWELLVKRVLQIVRKRSALKK